MNEELTNLFERQFKRFAEIHGREPDAGDLVFPGLDVDKMYETTLPLLANVGADPAWIYAYQKTGLMVTEINKDLIPDEDLKEWRAAIDEFAVLFPSGC